MSERSIDAPQTPTRRETSKTPRFELILDVATQMFFENGYREATIRDIADGAGLLPGSVYHYVKGKEELLFRILENFHDETNDSFQRLDEMEAPPAVKIRQLVVEQIGYNISRRREATLFHRDFRSLTGPRLATIVRLRDERDRILRTMIRQGLDAGEVREGMDVKLTSFAIYGVINSIPLWYQPTGPVNTETISNLFADFVLSGITPN